MWKVAEFGQLTGCPLNFATMGGGREITPGTDIGEPASLYTEAFIDRLEIDGK